jgi:3'-5' exonuclease
MINLFFDIETIPSAEEHKEIHVEILKKKYSEGKETTDIELHEKTSLDGTFGRICCIGVIKEVDGKEVQKEVFCGDEKEVLTKFWESAKGVNRFIGHNILEFDFPFIYQRSIINGVRPRNDISFARYRDLPVFDTMRQWTLWSRNTVKLDTLAKVLGFPTSKGDIDGSKVWEYYKKGKINEISEYCMKDVELTRQVYKKMVFETGEDNQPTEDLPF